MTKFNSRLRSLIAIFLLVLPVSAVSAKSIDFQRVLHERFALYRQAFPHIKFIHASGGNDWKQEYSRIATLLGEKPDALDYEHPPEFSNDLMIVTMDRLALMLRHNAISETLFRADDKSALKGSMVCVVTIDPGDITGNALAPTGYMLALPDSVIQKLHPSRRLDPRDFLLFAIDHEVYHCLESAFIGGASMTHKTYGGKYNEYLRENSADAFALAMHRRQTEKSSQFAQNLMLVRSLWFLDGGPCYRTYHSLRAVQATSVADLRAMSMRELVQYAGRIRDEESKPYETFLDEQVIALQAAEQLGYAPSDYGPEWADLAKRKTESRKVTDMAGYYLDLYGRLFDDTAIGFSSRQ
ncbi:MAG: hypothetical protein ACWGOV_06030 [Acidiferrobacterales bacterium]